MDDRKPKDDHVKVKSLAVAALLLGATGCSRPQTPPPARLRLESISPEKVRQVVWDAAQGILTLKSIDILKETRPESDRKTIRLWSYPQWEGDVATTKMDLAVVYYAQGCDSHTVEQRIYGNDQVNPIQVTPWGSDLGIKAAYWVSQANLPSHMGALLVDESFSATLYFSQPLEVSSRRISQQPVEAKDRQRFEEVCRRLVPGLKKIAQEAQ